ncbi:MAG: prepilin peptidase [Acidobacteriota bacterium]
MILGGGSFYLVGTAFYYLKGKQKDYLGFGDVMLMTMVGSFLGMSLTLLTIFLGSLLGTLIGVPLEYMTKRFHGYEWPFGTFLGVAALFSSFGGKAVIDWYLRVSGLN